MKSLLPFGTAEIEAQLKIWEHIWAENSGKSVPEAAIDTLVECKEDLMPALFQRLKIFATLPITTATRERSFSTLKRVKTYLRNTGETNKPCVDLNSWTFHRYGSKQNHKWNGQKQKKYRQYFIAFLYWLLAWIIKNILYIKAQWLFFTVPTIP